MDDGLATRKSNSTAYESHFDAQSRTSPMQVVAGYATRSTRLLSDTQTTVLAHASASSPPVGLANESVMCTCMRSRAPTPWHTKACQPGRSTPREGTPPAQGAQGVGPCNVINWRGTGSTRRRREVTSEQYYLAYSKPKTAYVVTSHVHI
jgi:hypothetical protein